MDPNTLNTYPSREAAEAAQRYFSAHGLAVRPGPPIEVRAGFLVAYATPGGF